MPVKRNKVPKRISVLVADNLAELPELQELAEKGHLVDMFACPTLGLAEYDLILSDSACCYMLGMQKYLTDAIKGARARRYGVKVGLETEV